MPTAVQSPASSGNQGECLWSAVSITALAQDLRISQDAHSQEKSAEFVAIQVIL
jgi:hypothetical protein